MTTPTSRYIPLIILYEDQRENGVFHFHNMVLACVFDDINGDINTLGKAVQGRPQKGNSKLRGICKSDLLGGGTNVLAVYDSDKIRKLLNVPASTNENKIIDLLKNESPLKSSLHPAFLTKNLETVLAAVGSCLDTIPTEQLDAATQKKSMADREVLFNKAARQSKSVRDCVRKKCPSFDRLIGKVCELVRPSG